MGVVAARSTYCAVCFRASALDTVGGKDSTIERRPTCKQMFVEPAWWLLRACEPRLAPWGSLLHIGILSCEGSAGRRHDAAAPHPYAAQGACGLTVCLARPLGRSEHEKLV